MATGAFIPLKITSSDHRERQNNLKHTAEEKGMVIVILKRCFGKILCGPVKKRL